MKRSLLSLILSCIVLHGVSGINNVLVSIDTVNIAEEMVIGTGETGLPENLQGLWWMEDNEAPEVVASLGGPIWDADTRTLVLDPASEHEGVWAYLDSIGGYILYGTLHVPHQFVYRFNEDITYAEITVNMKVLWSTIELPRWMISFTMYWVEDNDLWDRDSGILLSFPISGTKSYFLRRIVTADGEPTDSFDDFLANTPETLLVARRPF